MTSAARASPRIRDQSELEHRRQQPGYLVDLVAQQPLVHHPDDAADDQVLQVVRQVSGRIEELAALAEQRCEARQSALVALHRDRAGRHRLDQAGAGEGGLGCAVLDEGAQRRADPLRPLARFRRLRRAAVELLLRIGETGQQAVFAILEVFVERRARDAGPFDDVLDRRALVAALGDDLVHRDENPVARVARQHLRPLPVPSVREAIQMAGNCLHVARIPRQEEPAGDISGMEGSRCGACAWWSTCLYEFVPAGTVPVYAAPRRVVPRSLHAGSGGRPARRAASLRGRSQGPDKAGRPGRGARGRRRRGNRGAPR